MRWTSKSFQLTGLLLAIAVASASSADAAMLGWWRMGDNDGGLTTPPADGAAFDLVEGTLSHPFGSEGPLVPTNAGAEPTYSTVTPGPFIYNPQIDNAYSNLWAMETDASANRERAREPIVVPSQFSYEVFVRFDDVSDARGIDFAYHRNNTNGGWQLEVNNDDTVELNVISKNPDHDPTNETPVVSLHTLDLDSTTKLVDGQWHHIGVILESNSQDKSDDAHLYIDYQLEVSGNVPDANTLGGDEISFYNGAVITQQASRLDESRYFDVVLPLDASGFLTTVPEPGSFVLLSLGLIGLFGSRRRQSRRLTDHV